MNITNHEELAAANACADGLAFARGYKTLAEAWERCERGDWMWWVLRKMGLTPKTLSIEFAQSCAERVEHLKNNLSYWAAAYAAAYAAAAAAAADADAAAAYAAAAADAAAAAAANAAAANAAYAAYAAADAAYADADAAYAAADALKSERLYQANLLRSLVCNPFSK